jgi:CheY-like chemotaxis protein
MPVMDGRDLLARLQSRAAWKTIPVVLATSDHSAAQQAPRLGASAVLLKPFDLGALTDLVGRLSQPSVRALVGGWP